MNDVHSFQCIMVSQSTMVKGTQCHKVCTLEYTKTYAADQKIRVSKFPERIRRVGLVSNGILSALVQ
jgi:hypothetical protein